MVEDTIGLETGRASADYIHLYHGNAALLAESLEVIQKTSAVILSALANVSSDDTNAVQKAFETGAPYLRAPDDVDLNLLPKENCGVDKIDAALNRLAQAVPVIKRNLIEACVHVVGADGVIVESEAELLRAISDTLDCPMPPFVETPGQ